MSTLIEKINKNTKIKQKPNICDFRKKLYVILLAHLLGLLPLLWREINSFL